MADSGDVQNTEGGESDKCTKKCTIITVSVVTAIAVLAGIIVAIVLLVPMAGYNGKLMSSYTLSRRTLNRFRRNHDDNKICWDRSPDQDSFFSVIDTHNHFRPFGGPPVPFETYLQWMQDAGILFSTMFGIGQLIKRSNPDKDPECCYYLHCPTFNFTVVPDPHNDRKNAEDYTKYLSNDALRSKVHLKLSATFPNLQKPENIMKNLNDLERDFPRAFGWAGELNVIKHALVGNGFFKSDTSPRITKDFIERGNLDNFFRRMERVKWPVTIHCDCGCDNYNSIPKAAFEDVPKGYPKSCSVPKDEQQLAHRDYAFWKELLGPFYPAFFYAEYPGRNIDGQTRNKPNLVSFKKVQHLHLMEAILNRYSDMKVVWAHMCLNKELLSLHPRVHSHIMERFLTKYPNLYIDISWDVLAKLLLLNYNAMESVERLGYKEHTDIHTDIPIWNGTHVHDIDVIRNALHEKWEEIKDTVHETGSEEKLIGPTHAFVIYLDLIKKFPDRFLTGTDFVSSMAPPDDFPGLKKFKNPPSGCMKDEANHMRQVTDTSAVNIFFNDTQFRKIVLGENYFKLIGLDGEYAAPQVCSSVNS